ncbi:hypothetical protein VCHC55C2_3455, partial [Vibrio cholerae HC-55C2]
SNSVSCIFIKVDQYRHSNEMIIKC